MKRRPIAPPRLDLSWKSALRNRLAAGRLREPGIVPGWQRVVAYRQRVTLVLTLISTAAILYLSDTMLRLQQMPVVARYLYLFIYALMIFFMASNFFKMALGTWHAVQGPRGNPWHPAQTASDPSPEARVAIVFPVFHEEVARLAAGMAATWQSLAEKHPALSDRFDVFLLSDSRLLEYRIAEKAVIYRLRESFPNARFFYRCRPLNQSAKMGNITDFCRRWGSTYKHLLVMDADSLMDGEAIVTLFRMMEGNNRLGILQTNPVPILRTSLFGRMQQFSARLYGSVFSYSLQAMYMGHASYIGHNAMIRIAPFIRHCILPRLSGPAPWGGKPMSHDIIESAMMARAGFEVWFMPEIAGSYEELPANIPAFLARERRWMQGNLQHLRFLFIRGIRNIHRETFLTGAMGYLAAPLWAAFLLVSAFGMFHFLETGIMAVSGIQMLAMPMLMLFLSSMVFLFLPRVVSVAIYMRSDKARGFGGKDKLLWSVFLETLFSLVFSPIQMMAVSRFLWLWLKRRTMSWDTQTRDDAALSWRVCINHFGWISVVGGAALAVILYRVGEIPAVGTALLKSLSDGWLSPNSLIVWLFPILVGFSASIWIVRISSFTFQPVLKKRIFAIPEETCPPPVVQSVAAWERHFQSILPNTQERSDVIAYALSSPQFYIWHRAGIRNRPRIARQLLPRIEAGAVLTGSELNQAFFERQCFHGLHLRARFG